MTTDEAASGSYHQNPPSDKNIPQAIDAQMKNDVITNDTIKVLKSHRVYRTFDPDAVIPPQALTAIIQSAQQAPSWMNGQHYSMIHVSDAALKAKIAQLQPNNPQIAQCSVFLIFIMDGYRAWLASDQHGGSFAGFADADTLIILATDTAMAAQNAIVAAESLGYATCPIGGLRLINHTLIELLNLPKYTYVAFGLCIGKPAVAMPLKPRLPTEAVFFENRYQSEKLPQLLADYEQTMLEFGETREKFPYRQKFALYYSQRYLKDGEAWLKQQGFIK